MAMDSDSDTKTLREAEYYEHLAEGKTKCLLCPHGCVLGDGQSGLCRSRKNIGGRLYATNYGRVCALNIDPIEKKPLLHVHPGQPCLSLGCTGCNLSCLNCQNWEISQTAPSGVGSTPVSPRQFAQTAIANGCRIVAFTYTEPLTYIEYTRDCAQACREAGLETVLVTAGYVNPKPLSDLMPYLSAANIDLKSFSDDVYRRISHGTLQPVLDSIVAMQAAGVWVELTNLMIPGVNDSSDMTRAMCRWLVKNGLAEQPLHFSRFFPQYRMQDVHPTPLSTLTNARQIAHEEGLEYVYIGNTTLPDAEDTHCPNCGTLLVKRDGYHIIENRLATVTPEGICPKCGHRIAGRW